MKNIRDRFLIYISENIYCNGNTDWHYTDSQFEFVFGIKEN